MASFNRNAVLLMLLLVFSTSICDARKRRFVRVENNLALDGDLSLTVHCKSRDDDLGVKVLPINGTFEFSFKPNFIHTTQFYCSFQWPGRFEWFDIYKDSKDECSLCYWKVFPSAVCRLSWEFDINGDYNDCYPWNDHATHIIKS
ncbi:unnamed protein product [Prunus armeniaca]|uniref:S-protein homolog n=1 Tax=Prunus armeniaca TaxID=36596 RepID=A0A6J5VTI5_PRUAR|nr:unnamed protein product [Prunus armeniaca]CAB4292236.1 unnamed protein product [Prunus armeniaca]